MKIAIVGTGYVGLVSAVCFVELGHDVTGVDIDAAKVAMLKDGKSPIYEPGLEELLQSGLKSGRLHFTVKLEDALPDCRILFSAVATPQGEDHKADLRAVFTVAEAVANAVSADLVFVNKSTVPVGTGALCKKRIDAILAKRKSDVCVQVISNPEFLREGMAVPDTMMPDRIIVGINEPTQSSKLKAQSCTVYDPFCGTGVIPVECLLRGSSVLASDVSLKAVNGCEKNLEWARKTYKIAKKDLPSTLWKQDATKPFDLKKLVPDVIVTEGSLGPSLSDRPTVKDIEKFMRDADDLAAGFLKNCKTSLPSTPIVMTLPVWYAQKKMMPLKKIATTITECGYRMVMPPHISGWLPDRLSLLYRRSDQFVGREIVLLLPKK